MNVQPYADQITAEVAAMEQVVVATPGVTALSLDVSAVLAAALAGVAGGRVYPLTLPQVPTYPNIVYQHVSSTPGVMDGYHLSQADTFVLSVRDETLSGLLSVVDAMETAIEASSYSIEVSDRLADYDDQVEVYRYNIEIAFTSMAMPSQDLPAAMLYPVSANADFSGMVNIVRQLEHQTFTVLLFAQPGGINTMRRSVQAALLGFQVNSGYEPVEYQSGDALDAGGGLQVWQEVYSDALYIQES